MKVAVIGAGSFGTVLANVAEANGHQVSLWCRTAEQAQQIQDSGTNARFHPKLRLDSVQASSDIGVVVDGADLVILSVPSKGMREVCLTLAPVLAPAVPIVSTTKGIQADGFLLMSEVIERACPGHPVGVLSGPNLAAEIAQRHLSAAVIASPSAALREAATQALGCRYFRLYSATDRVSVELGGALKNIYAIASGLAAALQVGSNTQAALITRALAEMSRLASHLGGNPMTFLGLAGVGDLMVTCTSPLSRNYRVGWHLGQGLSLSAAEQAVGQVAEGINTLELVHQRALSMGVTMPIVSGLYEVIFGQKPARSVAMQFMQAASTSDVEFVLPGVPGP